MPKIISMAIKKIIKAPATANELTSMPIGQFTPKEKTLLKPAYVTLCIAGGRRDKVRKGDILGALTGEAGISGQAVGKIDVMNNAAYVAITTEVFD